MAKVILTAGHAVVNGIGTGAKVPGFDEAIEAVILRNAIATRLIERGVNVYVDQNEHQRRNVEQNQGNRSL
ncbi:hypothetical protein [Salmonirosea aquatica]|uniref:Uncharacterized protein n=1 Tax=Salmonirosea aquatica TaxID=2654236 RepID=A0A7C9F4C7_9BACT|nr:hypothetical protein [Cytophagaceae bacterium SJW1-29]